MNFEKNVKKRTYAYSFTQHLITQLPEVTTGKSRTVTNIKHLARKLSVDTRNYNATENCVRDKRL